MIRSKSSISKIVGLMDELENRYDQIDSLDIDNPMYIVVVDYIRKLELTLSQELSQKK